MNVQDRTTVHYARRYPVGPTAYPHRKNAAEWVLWAVLWPIGKAARVWDSWCRRARGAADGGG